MAQKWEYLLVNNGKAGVSIVHPDGREQAVKTSVFRAQADLCKELNRLGEEGWEGVGFASGTFILFKRQKP